MKSIHPRSKATASIGILAGAVLLALAAGCSTRPRNGPPSGAVPAHVGSEQLTPSDQTYLAQRIESGQILLDGRADEPAWSHAAVESSFGFPWKSALAPRTEFRALWDHENLYFTFRVEDADIVVLDNWRDELDGVFEDRVELYFSRDAKMRDYFCAEIDSRGRVLDYRARFYRQFDMNWRFPGLETKATVRPDGYEVEGCIPLRELATLGFPAVRAGVKIRIGLYRAEFSHDRSGRAASPPGIHTLGRQPAGPPPVEEWISWVNPGTAEPDFHVPASLGWLEFVK